MEANPYYFRGLPKLHKIVYKMISDDNTDMTQLTTGELDLWDTVNGTKAAQRQSAAGQELVDASQLLHVGDLLQHDAAAAQRSGRAARAALGHESAADLR